MQVPQLNLHGTECVALVGVQLFSCKRSNCLEIFAGSETSPHTQKKQNRGSFTFASLKFYESLTSCVLSIKWPFFSFLYYLHTFMAENLKTALLRESCGRQLANQSPSKGGAFQEVMLLQMLRIPKKVLC